MTPADFWSMGYAAFWDGYDFDPLKKVFPLRYHNEFVKGWLVAKQEKEENED